MMRAANGDLTEPGTYSAHVWTDTAAPERIPGAVAEGSMARVATACERWVGNAAALGADVRVIVEGVEWYAPGVGYLAIRPAGSSEPPSVHRCHGCSKCHGGDMICEETGNRARCIYCVRGAR